MIREVNLYKSIKDYYENDLHLKSKKKFTTTCMVWVGMSLLWSRTDNQMGMGM